MSSEPADRCARHPGRVAVDRCPVCDRARCADDATDYAGAGCPVCSSERQRERRPESTGELLIKAGLAALPAVFIGGDIAKEYVGVHIWSLLVPGVIGVAACWAPLAVLHRSGRTGGELRRLTRVVSGLGACGGLLATALGFRLWPGGPPEILRPWGLVGLPYVVTAAAALLWPYAYGGPKQPEPEA